MILLDRVTKTYPGDEEPTLDNISLHIEPHEFVFLVGESGAGKSTLIKMITKEENPDSGKILVGGIDLDFVKRRHIPHYRRRLGVVFQDFKLLPTRTVFENVAFSLEIAGISNRDIIKTVPKVLDLVGLESKANKFPSNLSGGERQRVAIARSMARQPKILIADEPTGNLDVLNKREIVELLQKINDFGTTLLVTTHDENVVNNLSKRVVTLNNGRIISDQKVHGIYRLKNDEPATTFAPQTPLEPEIKITSPQPIIQKVYRSNGQVRSTMPVRPAAKSRNVVNHPTGKPVSKKPAAAKAPTNKSTAKTPATPKTPTKKYAQDSANQWYAAGKPLRSAPKLSKLSAGQTVKLKPAPSIKQMIKRPSSSNSSNPNKPKQKRIV